MLKFMKNKILIPGIIVFALAVFFSFRYGLGTDSTGPQKEEKTIQQTVMALIEQGHFSPRSINDSFSETIFDKTIEQLDYEKKFFTEEDYKRLTKQYRNDIDDEIKANSMAFFNDINDLFVRRVAEAAKLYPGILSKPFRFKDEDSVLLDGDKIAFAANEAALKGRWEQYLKYRVLSKYVDLKDAEDKKAKDSVGYKVKPFDTLEKEARASILKIQDRYFDRLQKLTDNDRFSLFMNCITAAEDPHTDYFPPEQKKQFDEMMSGSFFGIGAALQQTEDGTIKISEIITGSPAWKSGKLKAKDVILKVGQGEAAPVEVEGMELPDVVKIIRGPKGTEVKLTVKHDNGTQEIIPITRGKVELDYLFAKSAVVEDHGKRIGYIYLPEFYADFNGVGNRRCAIDVKNEVEKLKAENVDAIILDLRNNGGGSLADVVDMAGIFVGSGPVVQVVTGGDKIRPLSNDAGAPIFTGPMAVLVNGNSASASEIMAAAMQDYQRAVIIGSRTYGKGTVQKLIPLDPFVNQSLREQIIQALNKAKGGDADYQGIGSLKLTIQKFYRINGGSTQLKGVTPDILLPDAYQDLKQGERSESSALPWDKIAAVNYNAWRTPPPYALLKAASDKRVEKSSAFDLIRETAATLKYQQDHNYVPLSLKGYEKEQEKSKAMNKKLDNLDSIGSGLNVINLKADLAGINVDSSTIEKNRSWLKALRKDVYLNEASNVLNDWIDENKKVTTVGKK